MGDLRALTRGQLAKQAGVNREAIRFYEREGLLPAPPRTPAGYRKYPLDTVGRLLFIRHAQDLGFSLAEIRDLARLSEQRGRDCGGVLGRTREKIAEVDEKIGHLLALRQALEKLAQACTGSERMEQCPILASLSGKRASE
jgi:MerR family transcriptional regulator, copper efflux regulator